MKSSAALKDSIIISKKTWKWAKARPEYTHLIEDLEDLEAIQQAKNESNENETVPFEKVIVEYEKAHKVKIKK